VRVQHPAAPDRFDKVPNGRVVASLFVILPHGDPPVSRDLATVPGPVVEGRGTPLLLLIVSVVSSSVRRTRAADVLPGQGHGGRVAPRRSHDLVRRKEKKIQIGAFHLERRESKPKA
jgi:hypothetical protein